MLKKQIFNELTVTPSTIKTKPSIKKTYDTKPDRGERTNQTAKVIRIYNCVSSLKNCPKRPPCWYILPKIKLLVFRFSEKSLRIRRNTFLGNKYNYIF